MPRNRNLQETSSVGGHAAPTPRPTGQPTPKPTQPTHQAVQRPAIEVERGEVVVDLDKALEEDGTELQDIIDKGLEDGSVTVETVPAKPRTRKPRKGSDK